MYSQTERQQRQQRLFGGAGGELRQRLDQFVHHHAQVSLQLLPPLLHKLGILQWGTDRDGEGEKGQFVSEMNGGNVLLGGGLRSPRAFLVKNVNEN